MVYIANLRMYQKTRQIEANPHVAFCYMATHHDQVRIRGLAERVTDRTTLQSIWGFYSLLCKYLGTLDNSEFILYRAVPSKVLYMKEWALACHDVPLAAGV